MMANGREDISKAYFWRDATWWKRTFKKYIVFI